MRMIRCGRRASCPIPKGREAGEELEGEFFETAQHVASRRPFLVAQEMLPAMRTRGAGAWRHLVRNLSATRLGA